MPTWLILALLTPAIYPINVFIDKYLLESKVKNYLGMPIYTSIAGFLSGTLAWIMLGYPTLEWFDATIVVISGFLSAMALTFYFKALSAEESSSVIILFQMTPVITLILAFLLLGESILPIQILGFLLLLAAALGATLKFDKKQKILSPVLWLILGYDILWASGNMLFRLVSSGTGFAPLLAYTGWGLGLGGLALFLFSASIRNAFLENFHSSGKDVTLIILINETIFVIARLITFYAITLASAVALVSVISSVQVFFGIVYGFILTSLAPKIFKENISKKAVFKKIIWALVAILGVYFLTR